MRRLVIATPLYFRPAKPQITAIMACDHLGLIANQDSLPWHSPAELQHFYQTIQHKPLIMGRKTFNSVPQSLIDQHYSIVFTHSCQQEKYAHNAHIKFVSHLSELKLLFTSHAFKHYFMIGGGQLMRFFLHHHLIDDFILSCFKTTYSGDTFLSLKEFKAWPRVCLNRSQDFNVYHLFNPARFL